MEKLSLKKKLFVIRLYLEGSSYDEIAAKASVSKGTVANVITELKAGRFPDYSLRPFIMDYKIITHNVPPVEHFIKEFELQFGRC